jgi:5-methyltetrahydropteroyltriglutamate--homocysteine methyltransferase
MNVLIDDVGSYPLPSHVSRQTFDRAYTAARESIIKGQDIWKDEFLRKNFCNVVIDSFKQKCHVGLDVVTYPQHYSMHDQFAWAIQKAMDGGTYVVDESNAMIPEVCVLREEAKRLYEEFQRKIMLRVCITGPLEMYLKIIGTSSYKEVLLMFAETVRRFAKNSILSSKYIETQVISLDEPSFGFQEPNADRETLAEVIEKAFDVAGVTRQIHLHSASRMSDLLEVKNIDVLSLEYAASPKNLQAISKKALDEADKHVRVGVARTDIDSMIAELHDKGIVTPGTAQLVEDTQIIRKRFADAEQRFGERMLFTGPDCGLGGWPSQEAAQLLLRRTVEAVRSA